MFFSVRALSAKGPKLDVIILSQPYVAMCCLVNMVIVVNINVYYL